MASTKKKKSCEGNVSGNLEDSEEKENTNCDDGMTMGKRRVTFPCDLVTSYCDPPNPWSGVSQCSTDELIAAYRSSCEKHEVRPISIVLQQLNGIDLSICNDRYEMLSLRGNKLDCRHLETLEEVFRRVQFKNLDFEDTNMDDDTAISLFDMVEYYETCTRLNIALNSKISCRGWQICSRMMKKTPQLEVLDVRGILFVENYMPVLARALRCGSMLRAIHMENCNISGRNLLILVSALKVNDHLVELFLANNKMVVSDGIQLGSLLKVNTSLQLLDLRNNSLGDEGVRHLSDGLYEQTKEIGGLSTLILWSNGLTHIAMEYIASALSRCRHLQTLNLGYNNITNEGAHNLREGLLRNRSLLRLSLQAGKIGCEGAVALAEYIADTKQLMRLDLRDNDIKTGGVMALALALKVNESISRLDLDPDIKKDSSIRDYAEQQREFRRQIEQKLTDNRRLAQQREEQRLEEEQLRLEIESNSIASSEITIDGLREQTLDLPREPPLPDGHAENREEELEPDQMPPESKPIDIPLDMLVPEPCLADHASPQLGSQFVHSPTDEVVSFLAPMQNITLLPPCDVMKAGDEPTTSDGCDKLIDATAPSQPDSTNNDSGDGASDKRVEPSTVETNNINKDASTCPVENDHNSSVLVTAVADMEDPHSNNIANISHVTHNSSFPSGDTSTQLKEVSEDEISIKVCDAKQSIEVPVEEVNG